MVQDEEPHQSVLFDPLLDPTDADVAVRPTSGRRARDAARKEDEDRENMSRSREENHMRSLRIKSPVSVTTIKRAIAAVKMAGVEVASVEVSPDGTIRVLSSPAEVEAGSAKEGDDIFEKWAARL